MVEALRSLRANVSISVAATVTVLITAFILGAFIASFVFVQNAVDEQKAKLDIRVYVSDSAQAAQVDDLGNQIVALQRQGEVNEFVYLTKDDARQEYRDRLDDASILDNVTGNPFPANFILNPVDPARSPEIAAMLEDHPAIDPTLGVEFGAQTSERFLSIANFITWAGLGLVAILLVASVLLIGNTIRLSLYARRREVEVMKLVGATNWFIRWPFVIEGVICGLIGALASVVLLVAVKLAVVDQLPFLNQGGLEREDAGGVSVVLLSVVLVAAGAVLGALGSGITLRRFLRV